MKTISQIKEWRIEHKMSQKLFAWLAGFNRNTYASWENGINKPSRDALIKLNDVIFGWELEHPVIEKIQSLECHKKTKKSILRYIQLFILRYLRKILTFFKGK